MTRFSASLACAAALLLGSSPASSRSQQPASAPAALADGTLIVLNKSEATASLIDLATNKTVATLPVGVGPHEVAVSPGGQTAVVCNYGAQTPGSTLTVLDLESVKVARTIDLPSFQRPHGIEFLPDGKHVAVTCEQQKSLLIVEINEAKITHTIDTTQDVSHMVALAPDGSRAYVSNIGSGSICVIDLKTHTLERVIACAPGSEGLDLSPDGGELWVGNRQVDTISVIDTAKLEVVASLDSATFPIRLKFTPDGRHVIVSNARSGDVAIFDARQRKEIKRIAMKATPVEEQEGRFFKDLPGGIPAPVGVLIAPDGRRAYIANTNADVITIVDLEKFDIAGRIETGKEPDGMAWTPVVIKASD